MRNTLTLCLSRQPGDPSPAHKTSQVPDANSDSANFGVGMYAVVLIGGIASFFAYQYLQQQAA